MLPATSCLYYETTKTITICNIHRQPCKTWQVESIHRYLEYRTNYPSAAVHMEQIGKTGKYNITMQMIKKLRFVLLNLAGVIKKSDTKMITEWDNSSQLPLFRG